MATTPKPGKKKKLTSRLHNPGTGTAAEVKTATTPKQGKMLRLHNLRIAAWVIERQSNHSCVCRAFLTFRHHRSPLQSVWRCSRCWARDVCDLRLW